MNAFASVPVYDSVDLKKFETEIRPLNRPAILKGLVADWACVGAARQSHEALGAYLKRFDVGREVRVSVCPPELKGRYFYDEGRGGVNYTTFAATVPFAIDWLLRHKDKPNPESVYLQALELVTHLPGIVQELPMPLLPSIVPPRLWLANSVITQTHFDLSDNIACHVSGQKTFTLFPPDQLANLYPGPLDVTPSGAPVSQVSLEYPDFETFPRFREALKVAQVAHLEPGDAVFIPALWWHHVKTDGPLNLLINYWWSSARSDLISPYLALFIAALTHKRLPPEQRKVWADMYNYYIAESYGDPFPAFPDRFQSAYARDIPPAQMQAFMQYLKSSVGG